MFAHYKLLRVGIYILFGVMISGCSLFGSRHSRVGQGVAFPSAAESPPTSESSLPRPARLTATQTAEVIIPTPTIAATASAPSTSLPPANPGLVQPKILSFSAVSADSNPGKTVTFSWQSSGGSSARIYNGANGSLGVPEFWAVELNGSLTVNLPDTRRSNPRFDLYIYGNQDLTNYDTAAVGIEWPCPLDSFFDPDPEICPSAEAVGSPAVEQKFQGGRMIRLEEPGWIYVLYDEVVIYGGPGGTGNLQWERFDDEGGGAADVDLVPSPPAGYFAPTGSFGTLWGEKAEVQKKLGWALAPEDSFDGAWQWQLSESDTPAGSIEVFVQLQDDLVARLSGFEEWGWNWLTFSPLS